MVAIITITALVTVTLVVFSSIYSAVKSSKRTDDKIRELTDKMDELDIL